MKQAMIVVWLILASVGQASPQIAALPNPKVGAWFYNKIGATAAQRDFVLAECVEFSVQMTGQPPVTLVPGLASDALIAIFGPDRDQAALEYTDDCMVAENYRRFNVANIPLDAYGRAARKLDASALDALAGQEHPPEGELARQFGNDAWLATSADGPVLDPPAFSPSTIAGLSHVIMPSSARLYADGGFNTGKSKDIKPGPNDAVVVSAFRNTGGGMAGVTFAMTNQNGSPNRSAKSKGYLTHFGKDASDVYSVFVAPAGRYVMAGVYSSHGMNLGIAQYCIRTVSVEIRAGEVVHLGTFVAGSAPKRDKSAFGGKRTGGEIAPQIRVEPPQLESGRQALARYPDLASRLVPAKLTNGASFPCVASPAVFQDIRTMDLPNAR